MTYEEMIEILRGKVIHETKEEIQQRLNEIADAFEQLVTKCHTLERERDAAVSDIPERCATCKHAGLKKTDSPCDRCFKYGTGKRSHWKWRGVQDE